jgi:uncharacterized protein
MIETDHSRLKVVDALRGIALMAIALLHNIEHFDFYFTPANLPAWMPPIDKAIWETLFLLFAGKAYAIFSVLFGLTFFIQSDNQSKKGKSFSSRFAWRLMLLFCFSFFNSMFYQGDILGTYAIIGFILIPVSYLDNKTVLWLAILLMLQPYEWFNVYTASQHPNIALSDPPSWKYFGQMEPYITGHSFLDTVVGNLTNGRKAVALWTWESGRVFQTAALFMLGMLAGRKSLFKISDDSNRFWKKVLIVAAIAFIPLFYCTKHLTVFNTSAAVSRPLETIISSWSNLVFMLILMSGFFLLFQKKNFHGMLNIFAPLGRMSLSNYIIQSILGSFIYYGYGLGLYQYTGSTYAVLIGITLITFQIYFSRWWLKRHKQGPLETIWHRLTWLTAKNKDPNNGYTSVRKNYL